MAPQLFTEVIQYAEERLEVQAAPQKKVEYEVAILFGLDPDDIGRALSRFRRNPRRF